MAILSVDGGSFIKRIFFGLILLLIDNFEAGDERQGSEWWCQ
jgi:hypothetical protein